MKIIKTDITHTKNMFKALARGKWDLDGMEILAFADMMRWFEKFQNTMEAEVIREEAQEKARLEEQKKLNEARIEPKPVEDIIKPIDPVVIPAVPSMKAKSKNRGN